MSTAIKLPPLFATNTNYSTGPDSGTPTKVDPATPGNGFVGGTAVVPQHVNFHLNGLASAARRPITVAALRLRLLDPNGASISDTSAALGVASTSTDAVLLVKGDTDGVFRFVDTDLASQSAITVSALTSDVRKVIGNGSRHLAIGDGGSFNAFTTNSGNTWTGGGSTGLISALTDGVWDGTDFIVSTDSGGSAHSTNGVAWALAGGGSDIQDIVSNGGGHGMAVLTPGTVFVCGSNSTPGVAFAKTVNHGVTWNVTGGTIPSNTNYTDPGWLAGNGGGVLYWLGHSSGTTSSELNLFSSTDGATWTLRSTLTGLTLGSPSPKLLMCQDTGLLVAAVAQAFGGVAVFASTDLGLTWTERMQINVSNVNALGVARGRLFATIGDKLFASDGIGRE